MSTRTEIWDGIFQVPRSERGFDEGRPWISHPRAQAAEGHTLQTATFTSSLLLALSEVAGIASMRAWDLEDASDRDLLRQHVQEAVSLLAVLRIGLREYEDDGGIR